tara:strand:- start:189 stop:350 length:162 start_codon:yes stop_codon:yes gene_type:complete
MKQFIFRILVAVLLLLPYVDTKSKQVNRCIQRYNNAQLEEVILTLNHLQKPIL